jgi:mannan endo-1,4-beta-mannosidase
VYVNEQGTKIEAQWWRGFYTFASTFDVDQALANPDSEDYQLILRDIDAIAVQLKKFQDAGVPVLWRPPHECDGKWFWWGAKGPKPLVALWKLMYDRLQNRHNLIWVYTGNANSPWYPGDQYVDIIGVDCYPADWRDSLNGIWEEHQSNFNGRTLLAISEFGPTPDIQRIQPFGGYWSFFVTWPGGVSPDRMPQDGLHRVYNSPGVLIQGK